MKTYRKAEVDNNNEKVFIDHTFKIFSTKLQCKYIGKKPLDTHIMFEIKESEVCVGYGVFAVKDIPMGTLVLREKPLLG